MKDPNERLFEKEHIGTESEQHENDQDGNWEESQQIDEEGNELDPEDIK